MINNEVLCSLFNAALKFSLKHLNTFLSDNTKQT